MDFTYHFYVIFFSWENLSIYVISTISWYPYTFGRVLAYHSHQNDRKRRWKLSKTVSKADPFENASFGKASFLVWRGENGGFWKRWRKACHILSFLLAFSPVLVWISETASKNTSFLSKTHEWGQEKIKQNKNACVSKILCFVFTAAKTDTLYKKRTLERINITSVVPS